MKTRLTILTLLLAFASAFGQYPTALDHNTTPGQTLRAPLAAEAQGSYSGSPVGTANPDLPTWLSNASASLIGLENVVGLPSNPANGTLLGNVQISKVASLGPIYVTGASYEDEWNLYALGASGATLLPEPSSYSDGNSWIHDVCTYLNLPCVGRYTTAGQSPNPRGTNYAVAGAGTYYGGPSNLQSVPLQIAQLITDNGPTLPSGSIVIMGAFWPNDLSLSIASYGGMWAPPSGPQSWAVSSSGAFTTPTAGNFVTVSVVSSTGMIVGQGLAFSIGGAYYYPNPITAIPDGTHVTIGASPYGALAVPNSAVIQTAAAGYLYNFAIVGGLAAAMANIVAALPSNGLLVVVNSPDISLMPVYSSSSYPAGLTIVHNTWLWYQKYIMGPYVTVTSPKVAEWDMNQDLVDVVTTYPPVNGAADRYGFKNVNAGLGGTYLVPVPAGYRANDWAFWDGTTGVTTTGVHPTGAMHKKYARSFIEWLKINGYVTVY